MNKEKVCVGGGGQIPASRRACFAFPDKSKFFTQTWVSLYRTHSPLSEVDGTTLFSSSNTGFLSVIFPSHILKTSSRFSTPVFLGPLHRKGSISPLQIHSFFLWSVPQWWLLNGCHSHFRDHFQLNFMQTRYCKCFYFFTSIQHKHLSFLNSNLADLCVCVCVHDWNKSHKTLI